MKKVKKASDSVHTPRDQSVVAPIARLGEMIGKERIKNAFQIKQASKAITSNERNDSKANTFKLIPELRSQLEQRRARVTPQAAKL
jgi:hypothetical protein